MKLAFVTLCMCVSSLKHFHVSFQFYKIPACEELLGEIAAGYTNAASSLKYMKTNLFVKVPVQSLDYLPPLH